MVQFCLKIKQYICLPTPSNDSHCAIYMMAYHISLFTATPIPSETSLCMTHVAPVLLSLLSLAGVLRRHTQRVNCPLRTSQSSLNQKLLGAFPPPTDLETEPPKGIPIRSAGRIGHPITAFCSEDSVFRIRPKPNQEYQTLTGTFPL